MESKRLLIQNTREHHTSTFIPFCVARTSILRPATSTQSAYKTYNDLELNWHHIKTELLPEK